MAKIPWKNEEIEYLKNLISWRARRKIRCSDSHLVKLFLHNFPHSHTAEAVRVKITINKAGEKNRYEHWSKEEEEYIMNLLKLHKYSMQDVALAYDDMFSESHFSGKHPFNSVYQKVKRINDQLYCDRG